jgi:4-carboxymuconolactone decarboxylase
VRALHPDLERWMVEFGYGRVLARPGLSPRERELVTVASLAALGWERQLVSHVLGALRVGATAAAVREALAIGARSGGARERSTAARTWVRASRYIREAASRATPVASRAAGPHPKPARF